jgi:hypothetical protein
MPQVTDLLAQDFFVSSDDMADDAFDDACDAMSHSTQAVFQQITPVIGAHTCPADSGQAAATQGYNYGEHQTLSPAPSCQDDTFTLLEGDDLDLASFGMPSCIEASDSSLCEMDYVLTVEEIASASHSLCDQLRSRKSKEKTEPSIRKNKAPRRSLRSPALRQIEQRQKRLTSQSRSSSCTSTSSNTSCTSTSSNAVAPVPKKLCADSRSNSSSSGASRRSCRACKKVLCNCKAMICGVVKADDWKWTLATFPSSVKTELDTHHSNEAIHSGTTFVEQMGETPPKKSAQTPVQSLMKFEETEVKYEMTSQEIAIKEEHVKREPIKWEPIKNEPLQKEPVKQEQVKNENVKQEPVKQDHIKMEPRMGCEKKKFLGVGHVPFALWGEGAALAPITAVASPVAPIKNDPGRSWDRQARARNGQKWWEELLPALHSEWQSSQAQAEDQGMVRVFDEQVQYAEKLKVKNQKLCLLLWLQCCYNKNVIALPRSLDLGQVDEAGCQCYNNFQPHDMSFFGWYAFRVEPKHAAKFESQLASLCGGSSEATRNNVLRNASVAKTRGKSKGGGFRPVFATSPKWESAKSGEGYFRHDFLDDYCSTTNSKSQSTSFPVVSW